MNAIEKVKYKLTTMFNLKKRRILNAFIKYGDSANTLIKNELADSNPFLISRLGTTESEILRWHLENPQQTIPQNLIDNLCNLSGVFPPNQNEALLFCKEYEKAIKSVDIFGVRAGVDEYFFWDDEDYIFKKLCKNKRYVDLNILSPFGKSEPWTLSLQGKDVLIIHPFEKSIINQYKKREYLFNGEIFIPEFNLVTIKAVQSLADNKKECGFESFSKALEHMKHEIKSKKFDVALIGAGAYGMILGQYCKSIGKSAIHIGGSLQLFFGISGKRWNDDPLISKYKSHHWIEPLAEETPAGSAKVEEGCYW